MRKGLNELHFEAIYAENQHCDTRGHTRAVLKGVGRGLKRGCLSNVSGGCAVLTRPGLAPDTANFRSEMKRSVMISRIRVHYDENYNMNRINNMNLSRYQKFYFVM